MALLKNKREREKPLPPPIVECKAGDKVIIVYEGVYLNGVIEELPYWTNDERYKRVRLDVGVIRVKAHEVVKNESVEEAELADKGV